MPKRIHIIDDYSNNIMTWLVSFCCKGEKYVADEETEDLRVCLLRVQAVNKVDKEEKWK